MFLGGEAGHGLEPVGIVGGAMLQRPGLHTVGNLVGRVQGQGGAVLQALLPGHHGFTADVFGHGVLVEHLGAEQTGDSFTHCFEPPWELPIFHHHTINRANMQTDCRAKLSLREGDLHRAARTP